METEAGTLLDVDPAVCEDGHASQYLISWGRRV